MSFRKWLSDKVKAPQAKMELALQKSQFFLGEPVSGTAKICSDEEFDVTEVAVLLTCTESVKKTRTTTNQYGSQQSEYWDSGEIYRAKCLLFQAARVPQGFNASYPFTLPVPTAAKETFYSIDRYVKWHLYPIFEVKGRPDIQKTTYEVLIEKRQTPAQQQYAAPVVKEVVKEVVLIPCSYCGALMPQTSIFCPNCGARRKT
jgi:hypothetical protein